LIALTFHHSDELSGESVIRGNLSAAEIAHQNVVAEFAEIARCPHDSPRRIEPGTILEAGQKFAGGAKEIHESKTGAGDVVVFCRILLRIGHKEAAPNVLNIKRRETLGNVAVVEVIFSFSSALALAIFEMHLVEIGVIYLHVAGAEIRDVEIALAIYLPDCRAFVNGSVRCCRGRRMVDLERRGIAAGPCRDRSVFRDE